MMAVESGRRQVLIRGIIIAVIAFVVGLVIGVLAGKSKITRKIILSVISCVDLYLASKLYTYIPVTACLYCTYCC